MLLLIVMVFYMLKAGLEIHQCLIPASIYFLDRDSYLIELIILKCYLFVLHSGVKDTLNE